MSCICISLIERENSMTAFTTQLVHCKLFQEFQWTSFMEIVKQITGTYNFLHSWTRNYWNNRCIMNEVRATSIFGVCKIIFFHQLTNKIISRTFSRRTSVDKCIKCSRRFCNIFWKPWSAESLPVNVLEHRPAFFLRKGGFSR